MSKPISIDNNAPFESVNTPQDLLINIQYALNNKKLLDKNFFVDKDFSKIVGATKQNVFSWENEGTLLFRGREFGWIKDGKRIGQGYTAQYYENGTKGQMLLIFNSSASISLEALVKTFGPEWKHGPRNPLSLEATIEPSTKPEGNEIIVYEFKSGSSMKTLSATLDANANVFILSLFRRAYLMPTSNIIPAIPLNQAALDLINNKFSTSPQTVTALTTAAAQSPFLTGLINTFANKNGSVVIGPPGGGTQSTMSAVGPIVIIDPTLTSRRCNDRRSKFRFCYHLCA